MSRLKVQKHATDVLRRENQVLTEGQERADLVKASTLKPPVVKDRARKIRRSRKDSGPPKGGEIVDLVEMTMPIEIGLLKEEASAGKLKNDWLRWEIRTGN